MRCRCMRFATHVLRRNTDCAAHTARREPELNGATQFVGYKIADKTDTVTGFRLIGYGRAVDLTPMDPECPIGTLPPPHHYMPASYRQCAVLGSIRNKLVQDHCHSLPR